MSENVIDVEASERFIFVGAYIILVPAVGTAPGFDESQLKEVVKFAHNKDALVLTAI